MINAGHWGSWEMHVSFHLTLPPAQVFDSHLGVTQSISLRLSELINLMSIVFPLSAFGGH